MIPLFIRENMAISFKKASWKKKYPRTFLIEMSENVVFEHICR